MFDIYLHLCFITKDVFDVALGVFGVYFATQWIPGTPKNPRGYQETRHLYVNQL